MLALATLEALRRPASRAARAFLAGLAAIVYGTSDEIHQAFVPARSPDGWDLVADATGALLAIAVVALWLARRERRPAPGEGSGEHPG